MAEFGPFHGDAGAAVFGVVGMGAEDDDVEFRGGDRGLGDSDREGRGESEREQRLSHRDNLHLGRAE